jgi:iron complex transport system substrate-binding protein
VKNNQVVALDDDVASRWGPRVVDLLRVIIDAVAKVPA